MLCLALAWLMTVSVCLAEETPDLKDDFFEAVNAEWLAQAEIPADSASVDAFSELGDTVQETLMADFEAMLSGEKAVDEDLKDFIEFYRLLADYETRNALGAEPLQPYLEQIENLESLEAFCENWLELVLQGVPLPFGLTVMADMGDASVNALYFRRRVCFSPSRIITWMTTPVPRCRGFTARCL